MSTEAADFRLDLIYEEAIRGLVRQERRLDELRARAAALLTAASISGAFLAGASLDRHASFRVAALIGTAAFALVGMLSAWLFLPAKGWNFVFSPKWMVANYVDVDPSVDLSDVKRSLAGHAEAYYDTNEDKLKWRTRALGASCALLAVELVAFIVDLRWRK